MEELAAVDVLFLTFISDSGDFAAARPRFQRLITEVVHATVGQANEIAGPGGHDWGIDTYVGSLDEEIGVWQSKFFKAWSGKTQRDQVKSSFGHLLRETREQGLHVDSWTLCVLNILPPKEQMWFDNWKNEQQNEHGIRIDLWNGVEIRRRLQLRKCLAIRERYFPERARGTPRVYLPSLRAYRVSRKWRPNGEPCPVSDTFLSDLGAVLCLDRGRTLTVVAALPGAALEAALNTVESGPVQLGAAAGDIPPRAWHNVEFDNVDAARGLPAGSGLVIAWPSARYSAETDRRSPAQVRDHVRELHPDSALIFLVEAPVTIDAIAAAADVAGRLGQIVGEPPVRVFSLVRPGDADEPPASRAVPAAATPPHALMALVASRMHRDSLILPYPSSGDPLGYDADPVNVAESVVSTLNESAEWGDFASEARAIGLIRDYAPEYFAALVRAHASVREGWARWSSLLACVEIDDHVDIWLRAAHDVGSPRELPTEVRLKGVVSALAMALVRLGGNGAASWIEATRARSRGVWAVDQFLASGRPTADFLSEADVDAVIAADRMDMRYLLDGDVKFPEASRSWWAALGRLPLTEHHVAVMAAFSAETRRIAGFAVERDEPDPDFAELAQEMRDAMLPHRPE